jgi:hypothetical protein
MTTYLADYLNALSGAEQTEVELALRSRVVIPHPGFASGDYIVPLTVGTTTDKTPAIAANVTAWPFFVPVATALDRIGVYLTTAQSGAAAMFGLYSSVGGRPSALLVDAGELDLSSGGAANALKTVNYTVPAGVFWGLVWLKNVATQVTVKGPNALVPGFAGHPSDVFSSTPRGFLYLASAYPASMPLTAPAVSTVISSQSVPAIMLRAT